MPFTFRWRGSCPGKCSVSNVTLSLLVLDQKLDYKFDVFEIPGFCSCKNVMWPRRTPRHTGPLWHVLIYFMSTLLVLTVLYNKLFINYKYLFFICALYIIGYENCNVTNALFTLYSKQPLKVVLYGNITPPAQNTQMHCTNNTQSETVKYGHCKNSLWKHVAR